MPARCKALRGGKSLLPAGVTRIEGAFGRGDAVVVRGPDGAEIGRGLIAYDAEDAERIKGRSSADVQAILGFTGRTEMIHRDDLVLGGDEPRDVSSRFRRTLRSASIAPVTPRRPGATLAPGPDNETAMVDGASPCAEPQPSPGGLGALSCLLSGILPMAELAPLAYDQLPAVLGQSRLRSWPADGLLSVARLAPGCACCGARGRGAGCAADVLRRSRVTAGAGRSRRGIRGSGCRPAPGPRRRGGLRSRTWCRPGNGWADDLERYAITPSSEVTPPCQSNV